MKHGSMEEQAYVRRFPKCDMIPIMAGTDVLKETTSKDGAVQQVSRRCRLHVEAPYLLKKIMGVEFIHFVQTNTLDRRNRTLQIEAYNESFSSRVAINENCRYSVHPENSDWTCFEQTATLDIKSFFGFESTVEKIAMKQYSQNISKGKEIIEYFIEQLSKEGITYIPRWEEPKPEKSLVAKERNKEEGESSSEEAETRDRTSSTPSTGSRELQLGASATNILSIEKVNINDGGGGGGMLANNNEYNKRCHDNRGSEEVVDNGHVDRENNKLDADYIKRCLGDLTPLQESRLIQLKKWVAELQKGKVPSDNCLLRFLRARDFNIEKAREMLSHSLIWRKKNQVDKMMSEYQVPQVVQEYFPGGWHHQDKECRPLYLLRLGQMDVKGLVKSVGEEGLLKHTLHICEEGLRLTEEATSTYGRPITTWTLLVDLEGLNMRHLWRPGIRTLLKIIEIVEANYPETMSCVLIIRAPRVFPILWTLVSTFIDDNTRSKFLFYGGNDYQGSGGLVDYMPKENIPHFLGGECKTVVHEGGLVPKSMYLPGEEMDAARQHLPMSDQSIYHSVSLGRGQVHEMVMLIEEPGSVICWDFDVMKNDVSFSVLRTKVPITHRPEPQSPTGAMGVIDAVMGSDDQHRSVIEKGWREGHEYFRVEPQLICHDGESIQYHERDGHEPRRTDPQPVYHEGESIQGSHVTSHMGTYILQWRYYESTQHTSPLDIIDSITAPKAKIMYYYETLKSTDYRGSMTSLQSCQSGFSSLSSNTNKSANSSCPSR
ncbi:SEC14-like protein 1 isoform X3 [Eriocheir sinensis]|uniref:SEC14-like protein 1 isoform X3 n=1 Tax=Eriocheir sinensis TaxID=95602 RepID=UPI0021C7DBFE|nr:SEC14-like protein 1 isoform X3 [Eriocheir sinensis]